MLKQFDIDFQYHDGTDCVAGYDEAGRGAMAGPFVAACCILKEDYNNPLINDSKKLSESIRRELFDEIKDNSLFYSIVSYDNKEIDKKGVQKINILSFFALKNKIPFTSVTHLIDGNIMKNEYWCRAIEKGDSKSYAIACASILAKVFRDEHMISLSPQYPEYNLHKNKGYGEDYISLIKLHGFPTEIHRHSYNIKDHDKQIKLF